MVSHCSHECPRDTIQILPNGDEDINPEIEAVPQPHVDRDFEERSVLDDDAEDARRTQAMRSQARITNRNLKLYGNTPGRVSTLQRFGAWQVKDL